MPASSPTATPTASAKARTPLLIDCKRSPASYRYVLRLDIVKHFPSLDHAVLAAEIARVVTDRRSAVA